MLLGSYDLLFSDPASFIRLMVLVAVALVAAITVHEFSHAMLSTGLGDATARRLGRLSLNPLRHLDPMGTVMLFVAGFGWGKPVPVNPALLRYPNLGMTLVAAAGPLSNFTFAFLLAIPIKLGLLQWFNLSLSSSNYVMTGGLREGLSDIVGMTIFFNILLGVFNLLPIAPLDGSKVVGGLLPSSMAPAYWQFERYGPLILIVVIGLDYLLGLGILWRVLGPIVGWLLGLATGY